MFKTARFLLAAFAVGLLPGITAPTFAAPAPTQWESVSLTLQPDQQQSMLLVSGDLAPATKLPYEAELAVPAGTQVQWVGEIMGGPAAADPTLKYVKSSVPGMDLYRFTMTESRTAQIEGVFQGMGTFRVDGYASAFKWTAWRAVPHVGMMVRMPQGSQIVQAAPGATTQAADAGFSYYTKTAENVKAGDVVDLTFSYAIPSGAAPVAGATPPTTSSSGLIIVLSLLAVGVILLVFAVLRKTCATSSVAHEDEPSARARAKTSPSVVVAEPERGGGRGRTAAAGPSPKKKLHMVVPTLVIVGVFATGAIAISTVSTKAQFIDGKITKDFGAASPCTSATIQVVAKDGVDLASQGARLLDVFKGKDGVGGVTLDLTTSVVNIGFCESLQTEATIGEMLSGTGLVTLAVAQPSSDPASATADAPLTE